MDPVPEAVPEAVPEVDDVAGALYVSIWLLRRQLRQAPVEGEPTLPGVATLARLDRFGPSSPTALAKVEQITPQAMGATLNALEKLDLVERRPDPTDGRRVVMSITDAGIQVLRKRRDARTRHLAAALSRDFTPVELSQLMVAAPLIERLAQNL